MFTIPAHTPLYQALFLCSPKQIVTFLQWTDNNVQAAVFFTICSVIFCDIFGAKMGRGHANGDINLLHKATQNCTAYHLCHCSAYIRYCS